MSAVFVCVRDVKQTDRLCVCIYGGYNGRFFLSAIQAAVHVYVNLSYLLH